MKYLNLTDGFNPYGIHPEGVNLIKYEKFFFNGGEPHIKINLDSFSMDELEDVTVTSRLTSMDDLMMLMVATEALNQCGYVDKKFLFTPYVPGSRQDRRMVGGEPLTIKVISNMINSMKFDDVITFDNHSDVSTALIDNCDNLDNHKFVDYILKKEEWYDEPCKVNLIAPDAGASKKCGNLISFLYKKNPLHEFELFYGSKKRDIASGKLSGFKIDADDFYKEPVIITDDIIDGGGTFIGLAKELKKKNAGDIYLIVSHGIFSKPLKELKPYFKKIYTTDSWRSEFNWEAVERDSTDLVEIVEFKDFM